MGRLQQLGGGPRSSARHVLTAAAVLAVVLLLAAPAAAGTAAPQRSAIYALPMLAPVDGSWATLARTDDAVSFRVHSKLMAGNAYTVWVVVFNKPGMCVGGCGEDDLFRAGPDASVTYGGGGVARPSSPRVDLRGSVEEGDASGVIFDIGTGLKDAMGSEIHLVVRDHGPVIPELVEEQTTTFAGGCADAPPGLGTPGPNTCSDVQAAIFPPLG